MATPYSVLMPLAPWESPEVVAEALRSLLRQSWQPTQLVVSCDGSPPGPLRRVLKAADLPMEILEGSGQEGVGPVLARGLSRCVHELVVRADADDICLPNRCERQLEVMQASPHADCPLRRPPYLHLQCAQHPMRPRLLTGGGCLKKGET